MKKALAASVLFIIFLTQPLFAASNWRMYTPGNSSLDDREITAVYYDNAGNKVWMGTNGRGVNTFDGTNWTAYKDTGNSQVSDIAVDGANVYVASNKGLWYFNGTIWAQWTTGTVGVNLLSNYIYSLEFQAPNTLWVGTSKGLVRVDNPSEGTRTFTPLKSSSNFPNSVKGIAIAKDGNAVWVATGSGVGKYDGTNWYKYTTTEGLQSISASDIAINKTDGTIWVAHNYSWDEDDEEYFDEEEDYYSSMGISKSTDNGASWKKYSSKTIGNLEEGTDLIKLDPSGNPWILTGESNTLIYYNGASWRKYNAFNSSLTMNSIISIDIDSSGNIWAGSLEGLLRYSSFDSTLSNSVNRADLIFGRLFKMQSTLMENGSPAAGKKIYIQASYPPSIKDIYSMEEIQDSFFGYFFSFKPLKVMNTNSRGAINFKYRPKKNLYLRTYYQLDSGALISRTIFIKVLPKISFHVNSKAGKKGKKFKFFGKVTPKHTYAGIALQRFYKKRWNLEEYTELTKKSAYSFEWSTKTAGKYKFRAMFLSDGDHETSFSKPRNVVVR